MEETVFGGETFKLACLVPPPDHQSGLPRLSSTGFQPWSNDEIMTFLRGKKPRQRREQFAGKGWVLNQGAVGSCCSAATTAALRASMRLTGANDVPMLNWEFLYAQVNGGRDIGSHLADNNRAARDIGVPAMRPDFKLNQRIFSHQYGPEDVRDAAAQRAAAVFECDTWQELATLVLSGQGAAVVAVHVGNTFNNLDRNGYPPAASGPGNHAVAIVDADVVDGRVAFDMQNSWGTNWGADGFCYLDWDRHMAQPLRFHKFFAILSANADAFDVSPTVAA